MGRMLIEAVQQHAETRLVAAFETDHHPLLGVDALSLSVAARNSASSKDAACAETLPITADLPARLNASNCLIDFTQPEGTLTHLQCCLEAKVSMVIGTTGFDTRGKTAIKDAAQHIPIVFAPNMAVGVNVLFKLLQKAARSLSTYDVEIIEAHHRLKVDAPSGTALRMGELVADAQQRGLASCAVYGREGHTGERKTDTIAFSSIRGGDIVGDHTAMFCGIGERLEITHKASSRMPYAQGAVRAALFLRGKSHGLYDMQDVLE